MVSSKNLIREPMRAKVSKFCRVINHSHLPMVIRAGGERLEDRLGRLLDWSAWAIFGRTTAFHAHPARRQPAT